MEGGSTAGQIDPVAASLPRHGGVKPPLRHADLKVSATTAGTSPAKPFTQEQVSNMVRDGFGDESGAKLIEQRGIDFAPARDVPQNCGTPFRNRPAVHGAFARDRRQ